MRDLNTDKSLHASDRRRELFELLLKDKGVDMPPAPLMAKQDSSKPCRLSIVQERLWNEWRSGRAEEVHNEVILLRLSGPLNVMALIQALNEVVRRHEILRTRFVEVDGQPRQYALAQMEIEVPLADLSQMPAKEREAKCLLLSREQAQSEFDLEQLPLIRSSIIALKPDEQLLVATLHQIVCDGWSRNILVNELSQLYESYITGTRPGLNEIETQYCDFAMWQRAQMELGEFDTDMRYWREKLGSKPSQPLLVPDRIGSTSPTTEGATRHVRLSKKVSEQIREIGRSQAVTTYMILLAGWYVLLSLYSGQEKIIIGTKAANRHHAELQEMIGPVWNTLFIKADLRGNPSFREVLRRVKEVVLEALDHQELPVEWVLAETAKANGGSNQIADVMFVIEERIGEELKFGGLKVVEEKIDLKTARNDLTIVMQQTGERFEGRIEYPAALFDGETIRRMAAVYERLMEVVASDLDCRVKNLPPLIN